MEPKRGEEDLPASILMFRQDYSTEQGESISTPGTESEMELESESEQQTLMEGIKVEEQCKRITDTDNSMILLNAIGSEEISREPATKNSSHKAGDETKSDKTGVKSSSNIASDNNEIVMIKQEETCGNGEKMLTKTSNESSMDKEDFVNEDENDDDDEDEDYVTSEKDKCKRDELELEEEDVKDNSHSTLISTTTNTTPSTTTNSTITTNISNPQENSSDNSQERSLLGRNHRVRQKNRYFLDFHCIDLTKGARNNKDEYSGYSFTSSQTTTPNIIANTATRSSNRRSTTDSNRGQLDEADVFETKYCRKCLSKTAHDLDSGCQACLYKKIVESSKRSRPSNQNRSRAGNSRRHQPSSSQSQSSASSSQHPQPQQQSFVNEIVTTDISTATTTTTTTVAAVATATKETTTLTSGGGDSSHSSKRRATRQGGSSKSSNINNTNNYNISTKHQSNASSGRLILKVGSLVISNGAGSIDCNSNSSSSSSNNSVGSDSLSGSSGKNNIIDNNNTTCNKLPQLDSWTPDEVADYILSKGFAQEAELFKSQSVDGVSLLLMQRTDFTYGLKIKLGPALKIYDQVCKLKKEYFTSITSHPIA